MLVMIAFWAFLIGIARYFTPEYIGGLERTRGTETSKYPEAEKIIMIP